MPSLIKKVLIGILVTVILVCVFQWMSIAAPRTLHVPFTCFFDGSDSYELLTNSTASEFWLQNDHSQKTIDMEPGHIPLKILAIGEEHYLIFSREMFDKGVCLWEWKNNIMKRLPLPEHMEKFIFRDAAFFEDRLEKRIYFVLYNVVSCCNQLYRIEMMDDSLSLDEAFCNDLDFGSNAIDENVSMIVTAPNKESYGNRSLLILGGEAFYRYTNWAPYTLARYRYGAEDEFLVEVDNRGKDRESFFLTMSEDATVAKLYQCSSPWSVVDTQRFEHGEAAVIGQIDEKAAIVPVNCLEDRVAMLVKDLTSLPCCGVGDMGSNNAEGRIPWSSVYFWNGLTDLLMPEFDLFAATDKFVQLRQQIEDRLYIEMSVLDQLLASSQNMRSNRYSRERIEHLCNLHHARVYEAYNRYAHYGSNPYNLQHCAVLIDEMRLEKHENSLDYLTIAQAEDPNGLPEKTYYLRCSNLLMTDGAAAPYNYMSGWVSSVCIAEHCGQTEVLENQDAIVQSFMSILLNSPEFADMDKDSLWPYFFGAAYHGYNAEDGISNNILFWPGQTYTADISYRYMDAKAIISMMYQYPDTMNQEVIDYLFHGIENGSLWPSVNEVLADFDAQIAIPQKSSLPRYSRARYSYQLQNAVWALLFLTQSAE